MQEITKEQFKEIFFANPDPEIKDPCYQQDYWDKFYENVIGARYFYKKPESAEQNRMMIVEDNSKQPEIVYRISFQTVEDEEFSFKPDYDGKYD